MLSFTTIKKNKNKNQKKNQGNGCKFCVDTYDFLVFFPTVSFFLIFFAVILYLTYNFLEMPKPICLNFSVKLILQRE